MKCHHMPMNVYQAAAASPSRAIDLSQLTDDVLYANAIEKANANELDDTVLYFRELQVVYCFVSWSNTNVGLTLLQIAVVRTGTQPTGSSAKLKPCDCAYAQRERTGIVPCGLFASIRGSHEVFQHCFGTGSSVVCGSRGHVGTSPTLFCGNTLPTV